MQLLSDDSPSTPPPPPRSTGASSRPSANHDRQPRAGALAAIVLGLAAVGGAAGAALGMQSTTEYEATVTVQVDQVMVFQPWEANLETARFAQALLRPDLQRSATDAAGLATTDIAEIRADRSDASPIVQVSMVVADQETASAAVTTLVDLTMRTLVESDQAPLRLVVDEVEPALTTATTELETITAEAGLAPGTNLAETFNQATYTLRALTAEQQVATEQWRIEQIDGQLAASQAQVDAIQPVLDRSYDLTNQIVELSTRLDPAQTRLQDLELGLQVLDAGTHRSEVTVSELSSSTALGRSAAAGTAIGIAVGLLIWTLLAVRRSRRA